MMKGAYGARDEADLVEHLLYELERVSEEAGFCDARGDIYLPVDSFLILQTIDALRRYQRLMTDFRTILGVLAYYAICGRNPERKEE